jgi:hypothetical protein
VHRWEENSDMKGAIQKLLGAAATYQHAGVI